MKLRDVLKKHEITDEKIVNDIEEYVSSTLAEKSDNMIPTPRFNEVIEQRNELRAELSELKGEYDILEKKLEKFGESEKTISVLEDENKNLKKSVLEIRTNQWNERSKYFTDEKYKEKADKIREDFIFPEKDKELTLEQVENNLKQFKPYEKAEYFEARKILDGTKPQGSPPPVVKDPLDVFPD